MTTWSESRIVDASGVRSAAPVPLEELLRVMGDVALSASEADGPAPGLALEEERAMTRSRGFEQGYSEGRAQLEAEIEQVLTSRREKLEEEYRHQLARVHRAVALMEVARRDLQDRMAPAYEQVGRELGEVVVTLVEDIVGARSLDDAEILRHRIERAVAALVTDAVVQLRLNPEDVELLTSLGVDVSSDFGEHLRVVPDLSVDRGGAVADSGTRHVDARISTSLAELRTALVS